MCWNISQFEVFGLSDLLCVCPFITAASNEQDRQTSARSGLGIADPA